MNVTTLEVRRDDLSTARLVTEPLPELDDGEALLKVERFALSANNVTYGALGDRLGYWRFFPASEDGWGRIPAWGFATALAGALPEGARAFGYVPMASHVVVRPDGAGERGFLDASPHRAGLPKAYNAYADPRTDPVYRTDREDALLLLRPLFILSFLLDDALGAPERPVIVSSASSKAALGFARLQAERGTTLIGLTSARNREFVERLDLYEAVATYDDPPSGEGAILVDVAGSRAVRADRTMVVGATHHDSLAEPDPTASFFFAPDELRRRRAAVEQRFPAAFHRLVDWSQTWLRTRRETDALAAYASVAGGQAGPDEGFIVHML